MKKHKRKQHKFNPSQKPSNAPNDPNYPADIEQIAVELDALARRKLPDRVLRGDLAGSEADIRQEAILLALSWFLRHQADEAHRAKYPWIPARALAHALKAQKRDLLKKFEKHRKYACRIPISIDAYSLHPAMKRTSDWSTSTMENMTRQAIRLALQTNRISHANAAIAMEVIIGGVPVIDMAARLNQHRSNIHQHVQRTRRVLAELIRQIEVPLMDPM